MFKIRSTTKQLAAAVLASGCFVLALGARAEAPHLEDMEAARIEVAACKSAKLSAWFDRQRQLTDGDFVPGQIATPRECMRTQDTNAANEAAPRKQLTAATKEPREIRRWDFEGQLGGQ
jgi:hypothetical protein